MNKLGQLYGAVMGAIGMYGLPPRTGPGRQGQGGKLRYKPRPGTKPLPPRNQRKGQIRRAGLSEKALARRKAGKSTFEGKATNLVSVYNQARIPVTITTAKGIFYTGRNK